MVHNIAIHDIFLPCSDHTDVRNEANWTYDLHAEPGAESEPIDINENIVADGATDDEYDQRERESLLYTILHHNTHHIFLIHLHTPYIFLTIL